MSKTKRILGVLVLTAIILFLGYILPITLTLKAQEITNPEITFRLNLFSTLLLVGTFGSLSLYLYREFWKKEDKYGNSFGFFNLSEGAKILGRKFSPLQLTLLSFIFFGVLFLIANAVKVGGFTSTFVLPQQFTPGESLAFSSLLIPIGEEMMALFVLGILVLGLSAIAVRYNMSKQNYKTLLLGLIPVLMGVFAILWHGSAYPGSDIAQGIVFIFWLLKTVLILVTGFIFIGIAMHMLNNFFIDFSRLYSSDVLFGVMIFIIIGLSVLYFFSFRKNLLGKKV